MYIESFIYNKINELEFKYFNESEENDTLVDIKPRIFTLDRLESTENTVNDHPEYYAGTNWKAIKVTKDDLKDLNTKKIEKGKKLTKNIVKLAKLGFCTITLGTLILCLKFDNKENIKKTDIKKATEEIVKSIETAEPKNETAVYVEKVVEMSSERKDDVELVQDEVVEDEVVQDEVVEDEVVQDEVDQDENKIIVYDSAKEFKDLVDQINKREGYREHPYQLPKESYITIGYGTLLRTHADKGKNISKVTFDYVKSQISTLLNIDEEIITDNRQNTLLKIKELKEESLEKINKLKEKIETSKRKIGRYKEALNKNQSLFRKANTKRKQAAYKKQIKRWKRNISIETNYIKNYNKALKRYNKKYKNFVKRENITKKSGSITQEVAVMLRDNYIKNTYKKAKKLIHKQIFNPKVHGLVRVFVFDYQYNNGLYCLIKGKHSYTLGNKIRNYIKNASEIDFYEEQGNIVFNSEEDKKTMMDSAKNILSRWKNKLNYKRSHGKRWQDHFERLTKLVNIYKNAKVKSNQNESIKEEEVIYVLS